MSAFNNYTEKELKNYADQGKKKRKEVDDYLKINYGLEYSEFEHLMSYSGSTRLLGAVKYGNEIGKGTNCVRLCLDRITESADTAEPMKEACRLGDKDTLQIFLDRGYRGVRALDVGSINPLLTAAAEYGRKECLVLLVDYMPDEIDTEHVVKMLRNFTSDKIAVLEYMLERSSVCLVDLPRTIIDAEDSNRVLTSDELCDIIDMLEQHDIHPVCTGMFAHAARHFDEKLLKKLMEKNSSEGQIYKAEANRELELIKYRCKRMETILG
jgi:hypothetical protein